MLEKHFEHLCEAFAMQKKRKGHVVAIKLFYVNLLWSAKMALNVRCNQQKYECFRQGQFICVKMLTTRQSALKNMGKKTHIGLQNVSTCIS